MTKAETRPAELLSQVIRIGLLMGCATLTSSARAQDVHSVASGSIQSVRAGISQNVHAGAIARGPGGERSGAGGFAVSEGTGRVVSGRAAGYGVRQGAGSQTEYASRSAASFGSGSDFPATDFVATMPRPDTGAYGALSAVPSGLGLSSNAVPSVGASTLGRSHVTPRRTVRHAMRDPDAILNPFTHTIGPAFGSSIPGASSVKETVLGSGKTQ